MKSLWMGSSFCVWRGGWGYVPMWHVPFRRSLMRGAQKVLAVKRDHGVPIAKINFIKNRGQILVCPLWYHPGGGFIYPPLPVA